MKSVYGNIWASLIAQLVKNLPAMQETGVRSLGQEDPLEKGMATDSSILAWKTPSLVAQPVKNPSAVQETGVRSLGQEEHLEKEMAAHSIILAWEIPRTKDPGELQFMGSQSQIPLSN